MEIFVAGTYRPVVTGPFPHNKKMRIEVKSEGKYLTLISE
jgi:hypothetical protein